SLYPSLYGKYLAIDHISANLWLLTLTGPSTVSGSMQSGMPTQITAFGETVSGELYAVSLSGSLYSISAPAPLPVRWISFNYTQRNDCGLLQWKVNESGGSHYEI